MTERPILFSGPMVRAILEGRKTQTRRIMKPQPDDAPDINMWAWLARRHLSVGKEAAIALGPYGQPGDRLWVRETWGHLNGNGVRVVYRANGERPERIGYPNAPVTDMKWRPSIFMRRHDSRITLEITEVRVQRLQDIGEEDAKAEGVQLQGPGLINGKPAEFHFFKYLDAFAQLWNVINGKRAPWASNPWVWCISFQRRPPAPETPGEGAPTLSTKESP